MAAKLLKIQNLNVTIIIVARSERGRAARTHGHRGRGVLAPRRQRRGQRGQGEDVHRLGLGSRALWPCGLMALWPYGLEATRTLGRWRDGGGTLAGRWRDVGGPIDANIHNLGWKRKQSVLKLTPHHCRKSGPTNYNRLMAIHRYSCWRLLYSYLRMQGCNVPCGRRPWRAQSHVPDAICRPSLASKTGKLTFTAKRQLHMWQILDPRVGLPFF